MMGNKNGPSLAKRVEDNVLGVLRERERELDDQIYDYSLVESKLAKNRDDETLESIREARLRELKNLYYKKQEYVSKGFGSLNEVYSDKEFFDACRNVDSVVVHFYRPTTTRCAYLDSHLIKVADSHFDTKFIKVNVEKTPYICEKFNIWCIPTLMIIKEGKTNHSIVGFNELGGDGFSTETLVAVLDKHGVKQPSTK
ncbi:Thioredoxin family protein [Theileria parva strain Muguga]|uniref:Thioredoxin domain-containing protein n=1 Tax=Theileria parva TaxID=5875 RepID=Q4N3C6_THEPA|nr:Thioredoxin family protein [Theileria parva strain Muguga]EAN31413.1 Thioredoxin family protein [Theileria parva strain Muguga]|eukprot:XP_763696.1 hypothetical protein [Theileria parva strain Muguga]